LQSAVVSLFEGNKMTKGKAITLGLFSIWPVIYFFFFMAVFFLMVATTAMHQGQAADGLPLFFLIIFPLHIFTMLEIFILLAIYLTYLFKTDVVPADKKALWAVALFLGHMIAMPVFWYIYIWKNIQYQSNSISLPNA